MINQVKTYYKSIISRSLWYLISICPHLTLIFRHISITEWDEWEIYMKEWNGTIMSSLGIQNKSHIIDFNIMIL